MDFFLTERRGTPLPPSTDGRFPKNQRKKVNGKFPCRGFLNPSLTFRPPTFRNFDPTQTEPGCTKHTFINEICWRRLVDMLQGHRNPFLKWQKIGKYFGPLFCPTLVLGLSKLTFKAPLLLYFRGLYQGQTPETAKSPFSSFSWWSRSPLLYYIVYCYPTIITQLCIKCKIYSQNTLNREKRATLNF